jgi:hypothetical protein
VASPLVNNVFDEYIEVETLFNSTGIIQEKRGEVCLNGYQEQYSKGFS